VNLFQELTSFEGKLQLVPTAGQPARPRNRRTLEVPINKRSDEAKFGYDSRELAIDEIPYSIHSAG
jgi:hypothetical protein